MSVYGAVVSGLFVTKWFQLLNQMIPPPMNPARLVWKVFVNQFFMSPLLNTLFFSWVVLTRDGFGPISTKMQTLKEKLQKDLR